MDGCIKFEERGRPSKVLSRTNQHIRATNVSALLFRYGLDELRRAYEAAREAPDRDRKRLEKDWGLLEVEVAAGRASFVETSDSGGVVYDRGEHAGETAAEIEGVLRIVREAFTIALFHFWERELNARMKVPRHKDDEAFAFLKSRGITPDESTLIQLHFAANVAKHGEGPSAERLCELRPNFFLTWNTRAS